MTKDELISKLVDLIDDVEQHPNQELDDGDIEDLVQEARILHYPRVACNSCWR